jgi:hypothetical protein
LIADPDLRTSVYPGVCSDIRVHPGTRTTQGIYPSLGGSGGVAARDTKSPSGAADDPTGWIADPGLRSSVYPDVYSNIRVRSCTHTTPEICPKLGPASGVAAEAAVSRQCGDSGGADLIASARSNSRRLRQTQWYCRNAHRNQSNFNRYNLSHIIFPSVPCRPLFERRIFHSLKYSARAEPGLLRTCRIFQCYARGERRSLVRDRMKPDSQARDGPGLPITLFG